MTHNQILKRIARAITTNNPECDLLVLLIDERPEEVTDMQRSVKGEVVASTFDQSPKRHVQVSDIDEGTSSKPRTLPAVRGASATHMEFAVCLGDSELKCGTMMHFLAR